MTLKVLLGLKITLIKLGSWPASKSSVLLVTDARSLVSPGQPCKPCKPAPPVAATPAAPWYSIGVGSSDVNTLLAVLLLSCLAAVAPELGPEFPPRELLSALALLEPLWWPPISVPKAPRRGPTFSFRIRLSGLLEYPSAARWLMATWFLYSVSWRL